MSKKTVVAIALGNSESNLERATASTANGIIRWAKKNGWEICDLSSWHLAIPKSVKLDGLIYRKNFSSLEKLDRLIEKIPHRVEILPSKRTEPVPCVLIDWESVGLQAAGYYLERGFRNFALAAYRQDEWTQSLRVFKERIEQAGGQCQAVQGMHMDNVDMDTVSTSVRQQLRDLITPLGIFCANDRLAVRLCHWCLAEGIAVPEQAAILGYGNDTIACLSNPVPLSSIDPYPEQYGIEAARLLQRMIDGEMVLPNTVIPVSPRGIITRRSTDIIAVQDTCVAHALRYIWDHYAKNIGADDVASFCGIPRRSLDRNFKKALGRTIGKEIMRQRFAKARELLITTETPAVDIAARVGFMTPQYFNFQFKKKFGIPPQAYRERERGKDGASR